MENIEGHYIATNTQYLRLYQALTREGYRLFSFRGIKSERIEELLKLLESPDAESRELGRQLLKQSQTQ